MTFFDKLRVLSFAIQNRVRSMVFEFLYIVEGGGTPLNRIPEGLFLRFSTNFAFFFSPSKLSSLSVFLVFVDSRGRGPLINVFLRVYFYVFRQTSRYIFRNTKQSLFYVF